MKAKQVIFFANGNIMVFDKDGEQIPKCQGCILDIEVIKNLNKYCDKSTEFYFGDWREKTKSPLNVKWWFEKKVNQNET